MSILLQENLFCHGVRNRFLLKVFTLFLLVAIQCLESTYGIDTSDEQCVAKYQVQKNLLDIFNAQLAVEVSHHY